MARYKPYSYAQGKFIPVHFAKQILPGTFEYSLNHLIDHVLDLSLFDARFGNDQTGATAYDPRILLKIVLYAYSRGIVSSRKIEQERERKREKEERKRVRGEKEGEKEGQREREKEGQA